MCAIIKSCKQTDFCLQVVMTITSGANAKNCTMKCQIRDELLFLAAFQIHYSHWLCTVIGCDQYSQFTVGFATQLKAVLSTAKIFAVNMSNTQQHSNSIKNQIESRWNPSIYRQSFGNDCYLGYVLVHARLTISWHFCKMMEEKALKESWFWTLIILWKTIFDLILIMEQRWSLIDFGMYL